MSDELVTRRLVRLATRQHGVVSVRQLYELGHSKDWLDARRAAGWMHPVHRGVYAVGHPRLTRHGEWMAAVLSGGERAALSHRSAAALWRIAEDRGGPVHITVRPGGGRERPGVQAHRRRLRRRDVTEHEGVPVTSVELALIDIAVGLSLRRLERAVDEAHRLGHTDARRLKAGIARNRGRRGVGLLRLVLAQHEVGSTLTRSELEERMLSLCRRAGLPEPAVNAGLEGFTVDLLWPSARLVIELDGRASHATPGAFQRDRDRDSALAAAGYLTLRFTWQDVSTRPAVVVHRIRRAMNARLE